jgi:hypothetical protein
LSHLAGLLIFVGLAHLNLFLIWFQGSWVSAGHWNSRWSFAESWLVPHAFILDTNLCILDSSAHQNLLSVLGISGNMSTDIVSDWWSNSNWEVEMASICLTSLLVFDACAQGNSLGVLSINSVMGANAWNISWHNWLWKIPGAGKTEHQRGHSRLEHSCPSHQWLLDGRS